MKEELGAVHHYYVETIMDDGEIERLGKAPMQKSVIGEDNDEQYEGEKKICSLVGWLIG